MPSGVTENASVDVGARVNPRRDYPQSVEALILFRPAPKPSKGEQSERNNQRDKRVRHVNAIGAGFKSGDEGGKAARWNERVEGGERQEHEAENAGDQGQRLCHVVLSSRATRRRQQLRPSGGRTRAAAFA